MLLIQTQIVKNVFAKSVIFVMYGFQENRRLRQAGPHLGKKIHILKGPNLQLNLGLNKPLRVRKS